MLQYAFGRWNPRGQLIPLPTVETCGGVGSSCRWGVGGWGVGGQERWGGMGGLEVWKEPDLMWPFFTFSLIRRYRSYFKKLYCTYVYINVCVYNMCEIFFLHFFLEVLFSIKTSQVTAKLSLLLQKEYYFGQGDL